VDKLGINLGSLIAFLVNFGLLFFLLNKFLFGSVRKQLDERRRRSRKHSGRASGGLADRRFFFCDQRG